MITAAAGMAACGQVPYAATFASFSAMLGAEQIRTDCAYPRMPVRIIGHHSGISMGFYGTSHHALEDLGDDAHGRRSDGRLRDATPTTCAPCCAPRWIIRARSTSGSAAAATRRSIRRCRRSPSAGRSACATAATSRSSRPAPRCAPRWMRPLLAERGIEARVVDMHTIKPLDAGEVRAAAAETGAILTVEEHNVIGGLGSAVAEVLVDCARVPFRRHGIQDEFAPVGPPAGAVRALQAGCGRHRRDGERHVARRLIAASPTTTRETGNEDRHVNE